MPAHSEDRTVRGKTFWGRSLLVILAWCIVLPVVLGACGGGEGTVSESDPPQNETEPPKDTAGEETSGGESGSDVTDPGELTPSAYFDYGIPASGERNAPHLGFHVADGGEIRLAGKRYCGFGVNYFGAFAHYWDGDYEQTPFVEAFAKLKEYGVDYIRMPFGGYWTDYYAAFSKDPEAVLRYLDRVVEEAEKAHIGIIVSLFWHDAALPQYLGEHRAAMGDPESDTVKFALDYTAAIVSRYASSPAVWAWEIGNEYNLSADLCDTVEWNWVWSLPGEEPSGFDYYTSDEMITFYTLIGEKIREYDGWRMIESGNGEMRSFAHASAERSRAMDPEKHSWTVDWTKNTRDEFDEMNARMTPDPLDCVCFHLQHGTDDGSKQYIDTMSPWGEKITQAEYFTAYKEAADACGKGCIFGEMGDFLDMNDAPDLEEYFGYVLEDIRLSGIQLALTWQFQDFTDAGADGMKLRMIGEANAEFKAAGVGDSEAAFAGN